MRETREQSYRDTRWNPGSKRYRGSAGWARSAGRRASLISDPVTLTDTVVIVLAFRMGNDVPDQSYDPGLEWPGCDEDNNLTGPSVSQRSPHESPATFRLTVRATSILPRAQTLAVIEGYPEVQIGRDVAPPGSVTVPRIRLKEMEVSKLHATLYWDDSRAEWGLVDMGSKHGTFHNRHHPGISPDVRGSRLSPPRTASMPRHLQHLDTFSIGSTTFVVHIHDDGHSCSECSRRDDDDEIPLFTKTSATPANGKRKRDEESAYIPSDKDPKKALSLLKKSLLSQRPGETADSSTPVAWVDRSARRRAMNPPPPPLSRKQPPLPTPAHPAPQNNSASSNASTPESLSSNNIGYRMLAKQGWTPGTSLGVHSEDAEHLVEPIVVSSTSNRAGLGSVDAGHSSSQGSDWREEGKQKLWSRLNP